MTKTEKLKRCAGCYNDFYNGRNDLGVKECWSLESAKMVWKKEVHIDQRPPWTQKAQRFLSCYRKQRHVYVEKNRTC